MPLTVLTADGRVERPQLGSGDPVDAFVAELGEVSRSIASGQPSADSRRRPGPRRPASVPPPVPIGRHRPASEGVVGMVAARASS